VELSSHLRTRMFPQCKSRCSNSKQFSATGKSVKINF
jgi:hypothetical protein